MKRIYLDYNATTPIHPKAAKEMEKYILVIQYLSMSVKKHSQAFGGQIKNAASLRCTLLLAAGYKQALAS